MKAARVIGENEIIIEEIEQPVPDEKRNILVKTKKLAYVVRTDIFYMALIL